MAAISQIFKTVAILDGHAVAFGAVFVHSFRHDKLGHIAVHTFSLSGFTMINNAAGSNS